MGILITLISFASSVASGGFYGLTLGALLGLVLESQWMGVGVCLVVALIGLGFLNSAAAFSVRCTRYAIWNESGYYYEGGLIEPTANSKIIPTLGALPSYFLYLVVACGCNLAILWVLGRYNANEVAVRWLALSGLLVGFIMGLKTPFEISWRGGLLR